MNFHSKWVQTYALSGRRDEKGKNWGGGMEELSLEKGRRGVFPSLWLNKKERAKEVWGNNCFTVTPFHNEVIFF